jgi:tetratricopeptide (TPR) repeat protein
MHENFDDSSWHAGKGGFGGSADQVTTLRTTWDTSDIWLRRSFEWQPSTDRTLILRLMHDDNVEVYLNGRQVVGLTGWNWTYGTHQLQAAAAEALHAGTNTIAVHCHQNDGGQLIDVGLMESSVSAGRLQQHSAAMKLADPWERLAGAYVFQGDREALDALLQAHPSAAAVAGDLDAADKNWDWAIAEYSQLITAETADASLLTRRAAAYLGAQEWDLAVADWKRAVQLQPDLLQRAFDELKAASRWGEAIPFGKQLVELKRDDSLEWLRIAPLYLLAGDETGYAEFCGELAAHFAASTLPEDADRIIKAALLRPGAIDPAKLPIDSFGRSLDDGTSPDWLAPWGWGTRALAAYRSGAAESAVNYVARSEERRPADSAHALNLAVLAMARHQLGNRDEAQTALDELSELVSRLQAGDPLHRVHDVLIARIMLHEAESQLAGQTEIK